MWESLVLSTIHSMWRARRSAAPLRACTHVSHAAKPCEGTLRYRLPVKSIHKQQTTIRKPIECAPEAREGSGRR